MSNSAQSGQEFDGAKIRDQAREHIQKVSGVSWKIWAFLGGISRSGAGVLGVLRFTLIVFTGLVFAVAVYYLIQLWLITPLGDRTGAIGPTGPNGADGDCHGEGDFAGQPGGRGGKGGNAGRGGDGQRGGDAGLIQIRVAQPLPPTVKFSCLPGKGGQPGVNGKPGPPGKPGVGGINRRGRVVGGSHGGADHVSCQDVGRAGDQGFGDPGDLPPRMPTKGDDGRATEPDVLLVDSSYLGACSSISQVLMMLHRSELDYLSDSYESTADTLRWIEILTRNPRENLPQELVKTFTSPLVNQTPPDPTEWRALNDRSNALLANLRAGLDYYGTPRNYVPLLAPDIYKGQVRDLIAICKDVEASCFAYLGSLDEQQQQKDALDKTIADAGRVIETLRGKLSSLDSDTAATEATIQQLTDTLLEQQKQLLLADEAFKKAVQLHSEGCPLEEMIKFVAAINHRSLRRIPKYYEHTRRGPETRTIAARAERHCKRPSNYRRRFCRHEEGL